VTPPAGPRFVIGIDLGTTNCAVAYVDRHDGGDPIAPRVRVFEVSQLVAPGDVRPLGVLPSFLYLADAPERASRGLDVAWASHAEPVGAFARDEGALRPDQQVSSAKSWLAYGGVDRTAPILPFGRDAGRPGLSPVEASTRYLAHIRDAWNAAGPPGHTAARLEAQSIVLTVPASFDEEARELTIDAARAAGFATLTLIEEPLAALYSWIARHRRQLGDHLREGDTLLVCDVGGGTSDFSLVRVVTGDGELAFERVAIGEHLLLGGDNLDFALAALVEERLGARLALTQRLALRRQCSAAKEQLLTGDGADRVTITVLGTGRSVVGGAQSVAIAREDVERVLGDGFLPVEEADAVPRRDRRPAALRELGLPYESDTAVTRHLARFLAAAARAQGRDDGGMVRPGAVLFNGGFFAPALARERVVAALARWFGEPPAVLAAERPEAAVALGAAYYGRLREGRDTMRRLLIRAGSPRSYYLGLDGGGAHQAGIQALAVLPQGVEEGSDIELPGQGFVVMTNRAVSFPVYSSLVRSDPAGTLVRLDEARDELHAHAPLVSVLRFGKRTRQVEIPVHVSLRFTELGTLELWLQSRDTDHRWRLQFQVRSAVMDDEAEADGQSAARDQAMVPSEALAEGARLVEEVFLSATTDAAAAETLVARLEQTFGYGKQAWPLESLRRLADVLLRAAEGRRRGPRLEARWLNLTGFCLRPGFGAAADEWRVGEARRVYAAGLAHPKDVQCQVEWLVLWQRVAGGFSAGQQRELAQRVFPALGIGARKPARVNPQIEREGWRLLASLERLDRDTRVRIGDELVQRLRRDARNAGLLWALGRLGARLPFYGPRDRSVPPEAAERWLAALLALPVHVPETLAALSQLATRTDDALLDVSDGQRVAVIEQLEAAGAAPALVDVVRHARAPAAADAVRYFGETLPTGLRLGATQGSASRP
jgi:hypothetical protein